MAYIPVYSSRINWENEPSIVSPINATNLNKMDYALKAHDDTLANWDITKANESDLLLALKDVTYDTDTGEFVFTWFNGTTSTVDLNIEKIPVSFSMDANGVITMTTEDGTTYTADVGALIKTYTFTDSSEIDFTVTTDASGNKTVTASIVAGSIDGTKLTPNYLADCTAAKTAAQNAANAADDSAEDAEAWAVGERDGVPVPSTDPAYENNAKYWATHSSSSFAGLSDTDITNPQNGQVPVYNSTTSKWENQNQSAGGGSTVKVTTSESSLYGQSVTLSDGVTTLTETFSGSGEATFSGVTLTGTLTVSASYGGQTATRTLSIPYFGNYTTSLSFFTATITVTFDASKGATCTLDGVTVSTSPYAFTVSSAGTYTASCTLDGVTKQGTAKVITTDGQTETDTIEYGTINVTYDNDFRGTSITCTQGGTTITKTAPSGGNTMAFYPPTTGTWVIEGTVGGSPYSTNASVTSLSTPVPVSLETIPDGSTKTPTDDVSIWLACAGIKDKSYTTLSQVIGDSETFNALLGDSNACAYMARSTTFASTLCADQYSMNLIGQYDVCCDALLADSTWASAIANSTYWESVLQPLVPKMTSDTTPSGEASASRELTNFDAWKAFNPSENYGWVAVGSSRIYAVDDWLEYEFPDDVLVVSARVGYICTTSANVIKYKTQDYDGSNWNDTSSEQTVTFTSSTTTWNEFVLNTSSTDKRHRVLITDGGTSDKGNGFKVQFYGRTSSSKKIHGGNGDTFYRIVDGNHVPVTDPALLDVGTYTIYSNGLAKDPDNLSNDYGKTVRICPNTKEIVVRPDNTLYWWGYESSNLEDMTSANGWSFSSYSFIAPTHNQTSISMPSASSKINGVGSKLPISGTNLYTIGEGVTARSGGVYYYINRESAKACTFTDQIEVKTSALSKQTLAWASNKYACVQTDSSANANLYAMWLE